MNAALTEQTLTDDQLGEIVEIYTGCIRQACDAAMPSRSSERRLKLLWETGKNREDVLLQTDSRQVLGPDELATLLTEAFFPDDRVDTNNPHHAKVKRQFDRDDQPLLTSGGMPGVDPFFTGAEVKNNLKAFHPRKAQALRGSHRTNARRRSLGPRIIPSDDELIILFLSH
ncbi:hypothetical protein EVAR_68221_1 [Eumeta japonica]|uniref:Uncharacterized protein n=1 Tax=Eumeta variegata TaxID=151549 RepID=A0A4C1ZHY3_EUMVA|nr:hypothetical protein EVAR_68221_1 [Eumeta japonica]